MTMPEIPRDPIKDSELIRNEGMRTMKSLGITRGIIEILADQNYTDAALELASLCQTHRRKGIPAILIDKIAIGFVSRIDAQIYEDAMVMLEILRPEMGPGL